MVDDNKFARDKNNKAIINTDTESYLAYKRAREEYVKIQNLNTQVSNIQNEMSEIKSLLKELINGKT